MILIVSFNARPIVHLAKMLGLEVAVADFWGDQDLFPLTSKVFTIFKPESQSYTAFPNQSKNEEKLVNLALGIIAKEKIESVLIGSGLDDRPDLWERLNSVVPILGNGPECIKIIRDLKQVHKKLGHKNVKFPMTFLGNNRDFMAHLDFPLVLKPMKTLGGIGIQLIHNQSELSQFFRNPDNNPDKYYVQEYIKGKNISTTMVGDKKDYKVLSINEQLIGVKSSGTNLPFKYCGNIIPFECPPEIAQTIENISLIISRAFKLVGVFGIDFVLQGTTPYFMEINPRFPGTIELLERISHLNAVKLHLDAVQGIIPKKVEKLQGFAMKQVLFAKELCKTPKFEKNPYIFDIPSPNLLLNPEDPICTLQVFDTNREKLLQNMNLLINQIYLRVRE